MSAYAIFLREETLDQTELDTYAASVGPALEKFSPEVLVAYGAHEVVEGPAIEGVVILRFPSIEQATEWYRSAEYQEVIEHRLKGGRYRGIIVEGVAEA